MCYENAPSDGNTVTITDDELNSVVYEFDTDVTVEPGNVLVNASGGRTTAVDSFIEALESEQGLYATDDGECTTIYATPGEEGNSWTISEDGDIELDTTFADSEAGAGGEDHALALEEGKIFYSCYIDSAYSEDSEICKASAPISDSEWVNIVVSNDKKYSIIDSKQLIVSGDINLNGQVYASGGANFNMLSGDFLVYSNNFFVGDYWFKMRGATSGDAPTCESFYDGAILYNTTNKEHCACNGASWVRMKDYTTACF